MGTAALHARPPAVPAIADPRQGEHHRELDAALRLGDLAAGPGAERKKLRGGRDGPGGAQAQSGGARAKDHSGEL